MADLRPLTVTSAGDSSEQLDADSLVVGAGITTLSGNLLISANGTDITIDAGKTLGTTGSGNINLPNNGSARFNIEGVPVDANVTAANLIALTDGSQITLHSHAATSSTTITKVAANTIGANQVAYLTATGEIDLAQANSLSTSQSTIGVAPTQIISTNPGLIQLVGEIAIEFDGGLTLDENDPVYLSATTAGRATNVAPSTSGQVVKFLGIVTNAVTYTGTAGDLATVLIGLLGELPEAIP